MTAEHISGRAKMDGATRENLSVCCAYPYRRVPPTMRQYIALQADNLILMITSVKSRQFSQQAVGR
jgi:hypothetical protein